MQIRRMIMAASMAAMVLGASVGSVFAGGASDQERMVAAGWGCAEAVDLPPGHCISPGTVKRLASMFEADSGTFQLRVFDASGKFVTAEIATFSTSADDRPCPHDSESPDGTYWDFLSGYLYVCHHQSE